MGEAGIFSLISAGFIDSYKPGALSALLLFVTLLYYVDYFGHSIKLWGFYTLSGLIVTKVFVILGLYDRFLGSRLYDYYLDAGYLLVVLLGFFVGILCLRDWVVLKFSDDFSRCAVQYPFFRKKRRFPKKIRIGALLALLIGNQLALLESAWPTHQNIVFIYFDISRPGKVLSGITGLLFYSYIYLLPFFLAFFLLYKAFYSEMAAGLLRRILPLIQLFTAVIYLSLGYLIFGYYI